MNEAIKSSAILVVIGSMNLTKQRIFRSYVRLKLDKTRTHCVGIIKSIDVKQNEVVACTNVRISHQNYICGSWILRDTVEVQNSWVGRIEVNVVTD